MKTPASHILVDANIAKSATEPARHPISKACLSFARLLEPKSSRVGIALTPALVEEWRRHASPTMSSWLVAMEQRKRVRREKDKPVRDLRNAIVKISDSGVREALLKDIHLSEAAILYGFPVSSRDDRQKSFLSQVAWQYSLAGEVQWFNPVSDSDWQQWVIDGCIDRSRFRCSGGT